PLWTLLHGRSRVGPAGSARQGVRHHDSLTSPADDIGQTSLDGSGRVDADRDRLAQAARSGVVPTVTNGRSFSSVLAPMPRTRRSSSTERNGAIRRSAPM